MENERQEERALTVFTVEFFNTKTGETVEFFPITCPGFVELERLALALTTSLNDMRAGAFLDWRQIAEHEFTPGTQVAV
ncbi:hypothetical protein ABZX93_05945 [Streptomyces sp. NPDC006632]|uniref:hypothetical protein n=1 Tax=Streptomyces sp. NPDC006632 TaxID=3157182 RepID=UPI00339EF475